MKMLVKLEIEESTIALIWSDQWGEVENLTPAEAIERALERIAREAPDNPALCVEKLRKSINSRAAQRMELTMRSEKTAIDNDIRVMRRDLERTI